MRVLRIVAEGDVTSFRYPYFMVGVQPTYEMPPPATIYGHVCSALGEWLDPEGVQFAYHFTYKTRFVDLEHTHLVKASRGKMPDSNHAKALEGKINPLQRELLFKPRLVLYLNRPEWKDNFASPRYAVVLGRSQDLFTYTSIEVIELEQRQEAYLEHTIAPIDMAARTPRGVVTLMPRFISYQQHRFPTFERYVVLTRRVRTQELLRSPQESLTFWTDPSAPKVNGLQLGLLFHRWV
ncbi:MAG: type I-B CRISPR-associated protein Cas5 [Firmicutes bacterium]|nr:type I-B CRISPR-associated protein Cas5 [Bacillota bacterium]